MSKNQEEKPGRYFQDALSDFVYDAASGRAIRHLAATGHTTAQIVKQLSYPTPFAKVQQTVTRYLKESGILLDELPVPPKDLQTVILKRNSLEKLYLILSECVRQNGEEHSYVSCPFGITDEPLSMLTAREREYIQGIAWEPKVMYHRLDRRMLEIGAQIALCPDKVCFYFLNSREIYI